MIAYRDKKVVSVFVCVCAASLLRIVVGWNVLKIEKQGFEIYEIGITETDEVKITSSYFRNMSLLAIKKKML
jgi:hypothetical protein